MFEINERKAGGTAAGLIVALLLLAAGCHKAKVVAPGIPEYERLYKEGMSAFREATPEGYARAANNFRKALALRPGQCEYSLNLAQSLLFLADEQKLNFEEYQPRRTEAVAALDALDTSCTRFEPFRLRLRAFLAGSSPEGWKLINQAVDLDSADAMNWVVHGKIDPAGRFENGLQQIAILRAVELDPDSALAQYESGMYYARHRKDLEAKAAFERAIALSPRHFRSYLALAYAESADERADVEPLYRTVVELAPSFLEGRMALGSFYAGIDEIDEAAGQYNATLALNPKYEPAHFALGLLMLEAERPDEAATHFEAVIALNPANYEAHYYLGNIRFEHKEFEPAKVEYQHAIDIRTNYVEAEYSLGLVLREQGDTDKALNQFERVVKMAPQFGGGYFSRAAIFKERGHLADAIADFSKAIDCYEQSIRQLDTQIAQFSRNQSRTSQALLKRAERDKAFTEGLLESARQSKAETESAVRKNPSKER